MDSGLAATGRSVEAEDADHDEADQGEHERDVDGRHGGYGLHVDDHALERRHERTAHDCHDEECSSERGVAFLHVFEGYAVDAREHDGHEGAGCDETDEPSESYYGDGADYAERRQDAEDGKQTRGGNPFHGVGAEEAEGEEHAHGADVIVLGRGLGDAEVVGILDYESPDHDLSGHIENLADHPEAVAFVGP